MTLFWIKKKVNPNIPFDTLDGDWFNDFRFDYGDLFIYGV